MNRSSNLSQLPRPQISLGLMMFLMLVCGMMSAGLFYASQVPAIQDEIAILVGKKAGGHDQGGRIAHLMFILFTLTSPLLLAGVLSTGLSIWRWFERRG